MIILALRVHLYACGVAWHLLSIYRACYYVLRGPMLHGCFDWELHGPEYWPCLLGYRQDWTIPQAYATEIFSPRENIVMWHEVGGVDCLTRA